MSPRCGRALSRLLLLRGALGLVFLATSSAWADETTVPEVLDVRAAHITLQDGTFAEVLGGMWLSTATTIAAAKERKSDKVRIADLERALLSADLPPSLAELAVAVVVGLLVGAAVGYAVHAAAH